MKDKNSFRFGEWLQKDNVTFPWTNKQVLIILSVLLIIGVGLSCVNMKYREKMEREGNWPLNTKS